MTAENLVFDDGRALPAHDLTSDHYGKFDDTDDPVAQLGSWLSRPVSIYRATWSEGTAFSANFSPWALFFSNANIKGKLSNFARLRCKLRVKFLINGTQFLYGSVRASYFPLPDMRSDYLSAADQVLFSQTPGVWLEPQNMTSAEMVLPFLWPNSWLDTTRNQDFLNMGKMQCIEYAALRSANGATTSGVTINVYAWAEDVEIMGLTTQPILQGKTEYEGDATISGPATTVAKVANKLADVPIIGPFAKATEFGATTVASIAKIFGYSNPPMIDDVHPYQPKAFHAFANTETRMPIDKLSIDPKNEVTISPSVAGIDPEDPLTFTSLMQRESFLYGTLWTQAYTPDTLLASQFVNPFYSVQSDTMPVYTAYPPMSYFSQLFRNWRGSLVYKFRFIKTNFHKGRVIISWDPAGSIVSNPDTETTTLSKIVDLEIDDEVEIVIPYRAARPWLELTNTFWSNSTAPTVTPAYNVINHNGCVTMRVQTALTGPTDTASINVLVFVRAGEDFTLAKPTAIGVGNSVRDPLGSLQGKEEILGSAAMSFTDKVNSITMGETFKSVRPLLHRSSLSQSATLPSTGSQSQIVKIGLWRIPRGPGRSSLGHSYAYNQATILGVTCPYHFAANHPIDWVSNAFVGVRGSLNMHLHVSNIESGNQARQVSVERWYTNPLISAAASTTNVVTTAFAGNAPNNYARLAVNTDANTALNVCAAGGSVTDTRTQAALSVNVPQYNPQRFYLAFSPYRNVDPTTTSMSLPVATLYDEIMVQCKTNTSSTPSSTTPLNTLEVYYAAGPDFQLIQFLCVPRIFVGALPGSVS